ncbi:hypothetical protein N7522_010510 [Penicillium canescens]|nr:hypothetical protein N7522_010510 [Penicillium canescens]KAJ6065228.1 hypothetical protein N7444_000881 [Penicillium canescens]
MDKEAAYELLAKLRAPLKTIGLLLHSDPHTTPPQPPGQPIHSHDSTKEQDSRGRTSSTPPPVHIHILPLHFSTDEQAIEQAT